MISSVPQAIFSAANPRAGKPALCVTLDPGKSEFARPIGGSHWWAGESQKWIFVRVGHAENTYHIKSADSTTSDFYISDEEDHSGEKLVALRNEHTIWFVNRLRQGYVITRRDGQRWTYDAKENAVNLVGEAFDSNLEYLQIFGIGTA